MIEKLITKHIAKHSSQVDVNLRLHLIVQTFSFVACSLFERVTSFPLNAHPLILKGGLEKKEPVGSFLLKFSPN